jgi:hypothetical protein
MVKVAGERVTLHYPSPEALDAWRGWTPQELEFAGQVRHAHGEAPPRPSPLADGGPSPHPLMEHWLH